MVAAGGESCPFLIISARYRWYEITDVIEDVDTGARVSASSYDVKVSVYEDRVRTWFLDVAQGHTALGTSPGDYVALAVALAYLEGVQQYRTGNSDRGKTKIRFIDSAARTFPEVSRRVIERLYDEARCGLFHSGFTDGPTILSHDRESAIELDGPVLRINPRAFVHRVVEDLTAYVAALRADPNGTLAKNFLTVWDHRWEHS